MRRKGNPLFRIVLILCSFMICIAFACSSDDDGYLFLLQNHTKLGQATVKIISTINSSLHLNATNEKKYGQAGLNYLLIAQMSEGYAKDYLQICKENEEGKLDTKKHKVYASTPAVLAVNVTETGFYSTGDGNTLPKSDIPQNKITSSSYGSGLYSLYKWGYKEHTNSGGNAFGGPFQYTPDGGKYTGIHTESIYHDKYNLKATPGGQGDCYNVPDAICGLNDFLQTGLTGCDVTKTDSLTKESTSLLTAITHNLGSSPLQFMYGIPYSVNSSKYLNKSNIKEQETIQSLNAISKDCLDSVERLNNDSLAWLSKHLTSPETWIASEIGLLSEGWYIDENMFEHILNYSQSVNIWNCYFPEQKVSNLSELRAKLKSKTKTLSELTGYSEGECDAIYGTVGGSHAAAMGSSFVSQKKYGTIMKVNGSSSTYVKKNAKQVYAFPGIAMSHAYTAIAFGDIIAAKMMKYAGVNIDPANPDTYLEKVKSEGGSSNSNGASSSGTYTPTNSNFEKELKSHGCDMSKLNDARLKVLKTANKMQGSRYKWGAGHAASVGVTNSGYDCSGFVYHSIVDSGISGTSAQKWCSSFGRSGSFGPSLNSTNAKIMYVKYKPGQWKFDDLKPGDILSVSGHVLLYVGVQNGKMVTMEAMGKAYPVNGWHTRNVAGVEKRYYVTRLKAYND